MEDRSYLCIDLKSFYASVECVSRGLDPMSARLVVADPERSSGTICLAVSPAMKALGVRNRCRVYEIPEDIDYIMAPPRMQAYIDCSAQIYGIYLEYISKDDISIYSIDEAFLDVTDYLALYHMNAMELGRRIVKDIHDRFGIPASCGVGTNLYLCKIALDITAKHSPDFMGYLDEDLYRKTLWDHRPLTDFWRIGRGTARRLENIGIHTMRQIASTDEELLYRMFGRDAAYLIDHAWGRETATLPDIKDYRARSHSLSNGQVLLRDYDYDEALLILKEMVDALCLRLVSKCLVTDSVSLYVSYSKDIIPPSQISRTLPVTTDSVRILTDVFTGLYSGIARHDQPIRRVNISFMRVVKRDYEQYDLFTDREKVEKDRKIQTAVIDIKRRYGKNSILKGMDLQPEATARERNQQIGGHKSGIA